MTAQIKAQKVYLKNKKIGGSIKIQNVCIEPGAIYEITINKIN